MRKKSINWALVDRSSQQTNKQVKKVLLQQKVNCHPRTTPMASKMTPSRPTPISGFILIFIEILFGIIFVNEMNENVELECELENVNGDFYNFGVLSPTPPSPRPHPAIVDFNISHIGLREQLVLKDVFGIFHGENNI